MPVQSNKTLQEDKCTPCEGGIAAIPLDQAIEQAAKLDHWKVDTDGKSISKSWKFKDFVQALERLNRIGDLAESEQHHPDLHLTGYQHLRVELTTHAIGGLSRNDFILAAKIDAL